MKEETLLLLVILGVFIWVASGGLVGAATHQPSAPTSQVDLRQLAIPYLYGSQAKEICNASGAVWHETSDWVGCDGTGSDSCSSALLVSAGQQCASAGANWTCDLQNVYCKR